MFFCIMYAFYTEETDISAFNTYKKRKDRLTKKIYTELTHNYDSMNIEHCI